MGKWSVVAGVLAWLSAAAPVAAQTKDDEDEPLIATSFGVEGLEVVPHAQYRLRYRHFEARDFTAGTTADALTHRARLGLGIGWRDRVGVFVQVQDVRVLGEELDTVGDVHGEGFDLHQGYARIMPFEGFEIRLGRQEIAYENERLIGTADWFEPGRSFDAIRFSFAQGILAVDSFYAKVFDFPLGSLVPFGPGDIDLLGGNLHLAFAREVELGLLLLSRSGGGDARTTRDQLTFGGIVSGTTNIGIGYAVEGYGQLARSSSRKGAILGATKIEYDPQLVTKPLIRASAEYLSGNGAPFRDAVAFDTLFGSPHSFHGEMNVFSNIPADTGGRGLIDLSGMVGFSTHGFTFAPSYHHFWAATPRDEPQPWGQEIDVKLSYRPWKYLGCDFFYGAFIPAELMKLSRGNRVEHFIYSTVDASF